MIRFKLKAAGLVIAIIMIGRASACLDRVLSMSEWNSDNEIEDFRIRDRSDENTVMLITPDFTFSCDGYVNQWNIVWYHREAWRNCVTVQFTFYVFRTAQQCGSLTVVGSNSFPVLISENSDDRIRVETEFEVEPEQRLVVQAGDFIGVSASLVNVQCSDDIRVRIAGIRNLNIVNTVYHGLFSAFERLSLVLSQPCTELTVDMSTIPFITAVVNPTSSPTHEPATSATTNTPPPTSLQTHEPATNSTSATTNTPPPTSSPTHEPATNSTSATTNTPPPTSLPTHEPATNSTSTTTNTLPFIDLNPTSIVAVLRNHSTSTTTLPFIDLNPTSIVTVGRKEAVIASSVDVSLASESDSRGTSQSHRGHLVTASDTATSYINTSISGTSSSVMPRNSITSSFRALLGTSVVSGTTPTELPVDTGRQSRDQLVKIGMGAGTGIIFLLVIMLTTTVLCLLRYLCPKEHRKQRAQEDEEHTHRSYTLSVARDQSDDIEMHYSPVYVELGHTSNKAEPEVCHMLQQDQSFMMTLNSSYESMTKIHD